MQYRALFTAVAATLVACDGRRLPTAPVVLGGSSSASVRFVNASASGPSLDFAVGGTVATGDGDLGFGRASACRLFNPASPALGVRVAGTASDLPGFAPQFGAGQRFTVLATGPRDSLTFTTLPDDLGTAAPGRARVRVFNAARTGGETDVSFRVPGSTGSSATITRLGGNATSSFIDLPSGAVEVRFTRSGTGETLLGARTLTLTSGESRTLVFGDPAPGSTTFRSFDFAACP